MINKHNHTIAVIIACYNAQDTIARAIKSALSQHGVSEVIVVDDCSHDNSVKIASNSDDGSARVIVLEQNKNQGPSAARNRAINHATADWIAILDADDFLLNGRMDALLKHADSYDMIADDLFQTDEELLTPPFETMMRPSLQDNLDITLTDFVRSNVTKGKRTRSELGFIKPIMRKSLLNEHKIRYQENMRLGEDYELYVRLLAHGAKAMIIPASGYVSIRRWNSLSGVHTTHDLKQLRDCNVAILQDLKLNTNAASAVKAHYNSINCRYQWRAFIDAIKVKDFKSAMKAYASPLPVPFYITGQLFAHFTAKLFKR